MEITAEEARTISLKNLHIIKDNARITIFKEIQRAILGGFPNISLVLNSPFPIEKYLKTYFTNLGYIITCERKKDFEVSDELVVTISWFSIENSNPKDGEPAAKVARNNKD